MSELPDGMLEYRTENRRVVVYHESPDLWLFQFRRFHPETRDRTITTLRLSDWAVGALMDGVGRLRMSEHEVERSGGRNHD